MMAAPPPLFATVIYIEETGHVLAAVTSGGLEPTLEDLTMGEHVRVRLPASPDFVNVPPSVLEVARVAATADLLDRPQHYVYGAGATPLSIGQKPAIGGTTVPTAGAPGTDAVVVWQDGTESVAAIGPLGAGGIPPSGPPAGATHQLLAWKGGPLYVKALP